MKWIRLTKKLQREALNQEFAKKKFLIIFKNSILILEDNLTLKVALLVTKGLNVKYTLNKIDSLRLYVEYI